MFGALVEILIGLWWVALSATAAAVLAMRAAWLGVIPKMIGALGSSALALVAASYWLDLTGVSPLGATMDMRRGASIVLWPAIALVMACLIVDHERIRR